MDDWSQLITAIAALVAAVGSVVSIIKIHSVEKHTNGIVEKLEAAAKREGLAQGRSGNGGPRASGQEAHHDDG